MSAVEVPPCCLERDQDPVHIYVNVTYDTQPVILGEKEIQEYQKYISEFESSNERKLDSDKEKLNEDDQDERENTSKTFGDDEHDVVSEEPDENTCQREDQQGGDDLLEDFRILTKQNGDSAKGFDKHDTVCVSSEGGRVAAASGRSDEFDEQDIVNLRFLGEQIIADSGLSKEVDEQDVVDIPFENGHITADSGRSERFDELYHLKDPIADDISAVVNGSTKVFNDQDAVFIPFGEHIVPNSGRSQEFEGENIATDSTNVRNRVNNVVDNSLINQTGRHQPANLDHDIPADVIREKTLEDINEKTDENCKADEAQTLDKNDLEHQGEESESELDDTERLRVMDSLRAEFINKVWDDYIHDFLINSGHVTQAAIVDVDTGLILAGSYDFNILDSEFQQILFGMQYAEVAYRNGVTVNGSNYKVRLADGRHGIFAKSGPHGCSVCKTNTLVIIGVHDESCDPRRCNEEVMRLGDFFTNKGM